jgi:AAA+ ATPase superfamily predicted ATPase
MTKFIGRERQLKGLKQLMERPAAALAVLRGRRRIGKSRLAAEFAKSFQQKYFFSGLPPEKGVTAADQRREFMRQLYEQKIPYKASEDWGDLFTELAKQCLSGQILVVLDEITWMCGEDPTFLGKLKNIWDQHFKQNDHLVLIISGSNSAWIKRNILSSTGFYGRISYRTKLEELSLHQCNEFWGGLKKNIAAYEKLKVLSVMGGIPRYLEEIHPRLSAEENIYQLCYQSEGLLFNEFDDLFKDLFAKRDQNYKDIITALVKGASNLTEVALALQRKKGGDLSKALDELCQDGFLSRFYSWDIKTGNPSKKISTYRVVDNYFRFYIKYILPHKHRIEMGEMESLPIGWESIMGLQFENLVLNNRKTLHKILQIPGHEIIYSNPYLQRQTESRPGCQIDYLVQTKFNVLYVCEIRFSKHELGAAVVEEVEEKIKRLEKPKGMSVRPILIHVNGITDDLLARDYFANVVNFADFL